MRTIAVDLGNTRAKFGYFSSTDASFPQPFSTLTDKPGDFESLRRWLTGLDDHRHFPIRWMIARTGIFPWEEIQNQIAAVRPEDRFEAISHQDVPMTLDVEFPEKVGIDRILAAYAALCWKELPEHFGRFEPGSRYLVVDAGSATTVDLISGEGSFAGGAIFPGFHAISKSLSALSPRLPPIPTDGIAFAVYPGKNTEEALSAGIYWGAIGAVRQFHQIVESTLSDAALPHRVPIFLAGGDAEHLYSGLSMFLDPELLILLPHLVLCGIALAARNCPDFPPFADPIDRV